MGESDFATGFELELFLLGVTCFSGLVVRLDSFVVITVGLSLSRPVDEREATSSVDDAMDAILAGGCAAAGFTVRGGCCRTGDLFLLERVEVLLLLRPKRCFIVEQ